MGSGAGEAKGLFMLADSAVWKQAWQPGGRVPHRYPGSVFGSRSTGQVPKGAGEAPVLEIFNARLDEVLHSLG